MNIRPINKLILAKKYTKKRESAILMLKDEEFKFVYDVVSVSDEVNSVKAGDRIVVQKYTGTDVEFNEESFTLILEEHVLAIVDGDENADS